MKDDSGSTCDDADDADDEGADGKTLSRDRIDLAVKIVESGVDVGDVLIVILGFLDLDSRFLDMDGEASRSRGIALGRGGDREVVGAGDRRGSRDGSVGVERQPGREDTVRDGIGDGGRIDVIVHRVELGRADVASEGLSDSGISER